MLTQTFDAGGLRFASDLINISGTSATIDAGSVVLVGFAPATTEDFTPLVQFTLGSAFDSKPGSFSITGEASNPSFTTANAILAAIVPGAVAQTIAEIDSDGLKFSVTDIQSQYVGVTLADESTSTVTGFKVAGFQFLASTVYLNNPNGGDTSDAQSLFQGTIDINASISDTTTIFPDIIVNDSNFVIMSPTAATTLSGATFTMANKNTMALKSLDLSNVGFTAGYHHETNGDDAWSIAGTATLGSQPQDSSQSKAFSFTATVGVDFVNSNFSGITFGVSGSTSLLGLSIKTDTGNPLTANYDFDLDQWGISGGFTATYDTNTVDISLGYSTDVSDPGIFVKDGIVESVFAIVQPGFNVFGSKFESTAGGIDFQYSREDEEFEIFGSGMLVDKNGKTLFSVTMGTDDSDDAGFLIKDGHLKQFDIAVSSTFKAGDLNLGIGVERVGFKYVASEELFVVYGTLTLTDIWKVSVTLGDGTSGDNSGLKYQDGDFSLDGFKVVVSNISIGFMTLQTFEVGYQKDAASGDDILSMEGAVYFPSTTVALQASFTFDTTKLEITEFSFALELGATPLPIGTSGMFLLAAGVKVENPNSPSNFVITGDVAVEYGSKLTLAGVANVTMVAAVGTVKVTKDEFVLSATVSMGAKQQSIATSGMPIFTSLIGEGTGTVTIDWGDKKYEIDAKLTLYEGLFEFDGKFEFDGTGNNYTIYIDAEAKVKVPGKVPFIGGKTLADFNFVFDYTSKDPTTGEPIGYVAAWTSIDLLFTHKEVGFLIDIGDTGGSSPKLIGRGTIDELKDGTYTPPTKLYVYSKSFSIPDGSNLAEFQVIWNEEKGTQYVGYEFVSNGGSNNSANIVLESNYPSGSTILANTGGSLAATTLTTQIANPSLSSAGTYTYYLYSTEKFNNNDLDWQVTYAIPEPTISVSTALPVGEYTGASISLAASYAVGNGLGTASTVTFYMDTNNSGYDGIKIGSLTPTADSGGGSITWNLTTLPAGDYYVYASISDGVNSTVRSLYSTQTAFKPIGLISGYVVDSLDNNIGVPGLRVYLDTNADGEFDPSTEPVWTTNGSGYYRFDYSDAAGTVSLVNSHAYSIGLLTPDGVTFASTPASNTTVSLTSSFNGTGIYADGATFTTAASLDGAGYAYSSTLLGTSVSWNGETFTLGPTGASDILYASGQTIALTQGNYSSLDFLGTGVNGSHANQSFVVTYTDNTTQTFTQGMSDWGSSQGYSGESIAKTMAYRNRSTGASQGSAWNLYGYSFALNAAKTLKSITLPSNTNLRFLAFNVSVAATTNPRSITAPAALVDETRFSTIINTSISGTVYNDVSQNKKFDPSETGAGGWRVYADLNANSAYDTNEPSAVSGSDGSYRIFNLSANTQYTLRLYQDSNSQADYSIKSAPPISVTTGSSTTQLLSGNNFGVLQNATIEGTIANYEQNSDGSLASSTTSPNSGWTVKLTPSAGALSTTVSLSSSFNQIGIYADGATFSSTGGFDGAGYAYSSALVGTGLTFDDTPYVFGSAGTNNMISATGQTISFTSVQSGMLRFLGASHNGNSTGQTFTITYTDGTTDTYSQSMSDWGNPQSYAGESTAITMAYRNKYDGTKNTSTFNLYEYSLLLNPSKTVASVTLPNNSHVRIMAMTFVSVQTTTADTSTGAYSFSHLIPGSYSVEQQLPTGWLQIDPSSGSYDFSGKKTISLGYTPVAMTYADFNNDGYTDLAVLSEYGSSGAQVNLYLNDGNGNFSATNVTSSAGASTSSFQFNFDHSGTAYNLIALEGLTGAKGVSIGVAATSGRLYVLTNLTTSTSKPTFSVNASEYAGVPYVNNIWGYATGDFDNNGTTDFVVSYTGEGSHANQLGVHLMPGTGEGLSASEAYAELSQVVVADLNLDGNEDLVWLAGHNSNRGQFQILYGNGDGTFQTPLAYDLSSTGESLTFPSINVAQQTILTVGDLNNDGLPDLVITAINADDGNDYMLTFWLQNSTGGFTKQDDSNWISGQATGYVTGNVAVSRILGSDYPSLVWVTHGFDNWEVQIFGAGTKSIFSEVFDGGSDTISLDEKPIAMVLFDADRSGLVDILMLDNVKNQVIYYLNRSVHQTTISVTAASGENSGNDFTNAETDKVIDAALAETAEPNPEPTPESNSQSRAPLGLDLPATRTTGSITGIVHDDANLSGSRESNEPPLANITVFIDANRNGVLDSGERATLTNAAGAFNFTDVSDGTYDVAAVLPPGYLRQSTGATSQEVVVHNGLVVDAPVFTFGMTLGLTVALYTDSIDTAANWSISANGVYLEVTDNQTHTVINRYTLSEVYSVTIYASNFAPDTITIDFSSSSFALPGGIAIDGGRDGLSGGTDLVFIGSTNADAVAVSDATVLLNGALTLSWTANLDSVTLRTGAGNDTISFTGDPTADTLLDAGADIDTLIILGTDEDDTLTLTNTAVTLNGKTATIAGVEEARIFSRGGNDIVNLAIDGTRIAKRPAPSLVKISISDSAGNDAYNIDARSITLDIEDAGGSDTLSFTAMRDKVAVNLSRPQGTRASIGVSRVSLGLVGSFETLVGSAFDDALTGDATANIINGGDGNDTIKGLSGDDLLAGSKGKDSLDGGDGNDVLLGGDDRDKLTGGKGFDLLIGGRDADTLIGGEGDDLLIAGFTSFDANFAALHTIILEWALPWSYTQRLADLSGDQASPSYLNRLNGVNFLLWHLAPTVFDDASKDSLNGGSGLDWYFAKIRDVAVLDTISGKAAGEVVAS